MGSSPAMMYGWKIRILTASLNATGRTAPASGVRKKTPRKRMSGWTHLQKLSRLKTVSLSLCLVTHLDNGRRTCVEEI